MKRELTAEQQAARDERKAKFRSLWKQVAAMPVERRVLLSRQYGFRTCEGHELSLGNQMLVALQHPTASVLGGFLQWLKHGRAVKKGEHGVMIWVPTGGRKAEVTAEGAEPVNGESEDETRFIIGTLFDVSQTGEVEAAS